MMPLRLGRSVFLPNTEKRRLKLPRTVFLERRMKCVCSYSRVRGSVKPNHHSALMRHATGMETVIARSVKLMR